MITLFENFQKDQNLKKFASLFFNKICEYDNDISASTYYDRGDYEIELNSKKSDYFFTLKFTEELGSILLFVMGRFSINETSFLDILIEYLENSDYFKEKVIEVKYLGKKFEILGTPEEVEEDLKNLKLKVDMKKYNL